MVFTLTDFARMEMVGKKEWMGEVPEFISAQAELAKQKVSVRIASCLRTSTLPSVNHHLASILAAKEVYQTEKFIRDNHRWDLLAGHVHDHLSTLYTRAFAFLAEVEEKRTKGEWLTQAALSEADFDSGVEGASANSFSVATALASLLDEVALSRKLARSLAACRCLPASHGTSPPPPLPWLPLPSVT
jgi:hypothetical protein